MQKLEITVSASSWEDAKKALAKVSIDDKSKINYRSVDNLYIVSVEKDPPLTDADYKVIKEEHNISILSDSDSRKRVTEILDKVYDVETQLRKLLLHVSDLVETYFEILNNKYTKGYVDQKAISISGNLDPITSHLTLGQMKDILGYDLSWQKLQLSSQNITDLMNDSNSFEEMKTKLNEKMQDKTVWTVIAENVLHTKRGWIDISGDLNKLKDFRDQSAHYQVVTEQSKIRLVEKADHLLSIITPSGRKLTRSEEANLSNYAETIAKIIKQIQPITIPSDVLLKLNAHFIDNIQVPNISASVAEAASKALQPSLNFSHMLQNNYGNLFASYNPKWYLDITENDEDSEKNKEIDDTDDPAASTPLVKN